MYAQLEVTLFFIFIFYFFLPLMISLPKRVGALPLKVSSCTYWWIQEKALTEKVREEGKKI
jgi:hypothetical protein